MRKAFTLIELLVVVLIIGILAAVALPQYQKAVLKSRYATLKMLTRSIAQAEEIYFLANGQYTTKFNELDIDMPGGKLDTSTDDNVEYDWGSCAIIMKEGSEYKHIRCRRNYLGYQLRLHHSAEPDTRLCIVFTNGPETTLRTQLCKAETGTSEIISSGDTYQAYLYQD